MSKPRIIAGKARGIRLDVAPGDITRPITDRVKEALFNIISADIVNSSFLDLFGGSGSVGIEALSRGGCFTLFIDSSLSAIKTINKNLTKTHLVDLAKVIQMDAFIYLRGNAPLPFNYIFIAPPQYRHLWKKALIILDENNTHLSQDGWIIVQIDPVEYKDIALNKFQLFDQRKYGSTLLLFYRKIFLVDNLNM